jgi:uncharacterized membrane protein
MAAAAAVIFKSLSQRQNVPQVAAQVVGGAVAEAIMVVGYFAYASLWLGKGLAAAASIPGNIVQGVFGLVVATAVYAVLSRSRALARI